MLPLNRDFEDLLAEFVTHGVECLVVGAHALAVAGVPRATGALDIWVRPTPVNAQKVYAALGSFGAPLLAAGVTALDFATPGLVYQMGLPPRRIDVLTSISGVDFEEARAGQALVTHGNLTWAVLGTPQLLKNKRAAGRPKDLADVAALEALAKR